MDADTEPDVSVKDPAHRCQDFDEDCPDIHAEGYCLKCWLHDPARGLCPYLVDGVSAN